VSSRLPTHFLCLISSFLLGLGLVLPALCVTPGFAEFDSLVKLFKPEFGTASCYSLISIILKLYGSENYFLAVVLFVFSVLFPLWKLGVVWQVCFANALSVSERSGAVKISGLLGKFSMLDVLVIAILVVVLKGLPGSGQVEPGSGAWAFGLSVFFSIMAQMLVGRLLREDNGRGF